MNSLWTHLCSWNNLLLAYQRASKGKRGQPNVAVFEHHLEDNLWQLQQEFPLNLRYPKMDENL